MPNNTNNNVLSKIYNRMLGVNSKKDDQIKRIDDMLKKIDKSVQDKDSINFVDTFKSMVSSSLEKFDFQSNINNVFQTIDHNYRLLRYSNSEEICDNITYCARALDVIGDGIMSPDDINKHSLQIILNDSDNSTTSDQTTLNDIREIVTETKLEEILPEIIKETLKLGDQFIEIADYTSDDTPLTQTILNENDIKENVVEKDPVSIILNEGEDNERKLIFEIELVTSGKLDAGDISDVIDQTLKEGPKSIKPTDYTEAQPKSDIKNIRLVAHDPRFVVKLQSKRYKMCLGYLVLPEVDMNSGLYPSSNSSSNSSRGGQTYSTVNSLSPMDNHLVNGVDRLYLDLLGVIKSNISKEDLSINNKEVKDILARIVQEIDPESNDAYGNTSAHRLKVRYVPERRMEHWRVRSKRFFPYGESIFFKTTFSAKLYILLQTCTTIKRISDSTDRRIIYLETDLRRDMRSQITEIQNAFSKKTQSINSFGSISSIPSALTTFETIFIPVVNGKRAIEFDTLAPAIQMRDITDELKAFRDTVVASLPVPPPYLNIEENISNKASLSFENGLFAQTLVSYQQMFSISLKSMCVKLHRIIKSKEFPKNVTVTFNPPKMLQMEREVEQIEMITRKIQGLVDMGIPKEYIVRNLIDVGINWSKVDEFKIKQLLDKKIIREPVDPNMDPGGGGMMPGGGGF